ncbi:DUF3530 family protein [Gynuella sunshinyii]|uniref:DUF3530 family protein n=1 Tax=Gynuella sunshinyii YC6258 TaxID=1445510 RepID=A0A0C5VLS0_9GAMM|nr:DUF3530 family protein [Gynuella sunshinyii]AJQ94268.1 hypothetical Protein YC6258_02230 [Gynuella sunshinyii YC6258]
MINGKHWPATAKIVICASLLFSSSTAMAVTEQQQMEDLKKYFTQSIVADQLVDISMSSGNITALFIEQRTASPQGAILIIPDTEQSPMSPELLEQVRNYLPDVGWSTLAIPLPDPASLPIPARQLSPAPQPFNYNPDQTEQMYERIRAGIDFLQQRNIFNLVLIGFGSGADWSAAYMSEQLTQENNEGYGLIMVNPQTPRNIPVPDLPRNLSTLTIPVLDIYFDQAQADTVRAKQRKAAVARAESKRNKPINAYLQILHPTAASRFADGPDRLTRSIWGWLKTNLGGKQLKAGKATQ